MLAWRVATRCIAPPELAAFQATVAGSAPPEKGPRLPARQAASHSASLGRRACAPWARSPRRRQNSWQADQETWSTGSSLPVVLLGLLPITVFHSCWVHSVSASQ